jgi:hypothetical protein
MLAAFYVFFILGFKSTEIHHAVLGSLLILDGIIWITGLYVVLKFLLW